MPYWKVTFDYERVVKADNKYHAEQKAYELDEIGYHVEELADDDPLAVEAAEEDGIDELIADEAAGRLAIIQRMEKLLPALKTYVEADAETRAAIEAQVPKGFAVRSNSQVAWLVTTDDFEPVADLVPCEYCGYGHGVDTHNLEAHAAVADGVDDDAEYVEVDDAEPHELPVVWRD